MWTGATPASVSSASATAFHPLRMSEADFRKFRRLLHDEVGIYMSDIKKPLMEGRLAKRLASCRFDRFGDYLALIESDAEERQNAIDVLTTNETYFFREPEHFRHLGDSVAPDLLSVARPRVWCGASSSGEEPYTIAMVLASALEHSGFEILASDISTRVLATARAGVYPMEDANGIPRALRAAYCLKGVGSQQGRFMIDPNLRSRVRFEQINLNAALPDIGLFDVIFLRNVMIYFNQDTKRAVVERVLKHLKPGGFFYISHSESLHGLTTRLRMVQPSVYRMEGA